jgi:hypothetical protein
MSASASCEDLPVAGRTRLGLVLLKMYIPALSGSECACVNMPSASRAMNVQAFVVHGVEQADVVMQHHRNAYHLDCNFVIGADVLEQEPAKVRSFQVLPEHQKSLCWHYHYV